MRFAWLQRAPALIDKLPPSEHIIVNKDYDSEDVREQIRNKPSNPVMPLKKKLKTGTVILIGVYIIIAIWLKTYLLHFRAIATGYDKLKRNYASILAMTCSYIWLLM